MADVRCGRGEMVVEIPEFIGRERELAVVAGLLESQGPRGILVTGSAGVGKTSLLAAFASLADAAGRHTEQITATPTGSAFSLAPFAHLEPVDLPDAKDPSERITRLVSALAPGRDEPPIVLLIDDVDRLDAASIVLVHQLVVNGKARAAMTLRDGSPLPEALGSFLKDDHASQLAVAPFDRDTSDRLLGLLLSGPADASTADAIWERALGNPLFTRELVLTGRATGVLTEMGGRWSLTGVLTTSRLLRDAIGNRLRTLGREANMLVRGVAVAGSLPCRVAEELAAPLVVADLEERAVLVTTGTTAPVVRFAHPLYGEILRDATPAAESRLARRQVAGALLSGSQPTDDDILLAATLVIDDDEAEAELFARAANIALERSDVSAVRFTGAALTRSEGVELRLAHARALSLAGHNPAADEEFTRLSDHVDGEAAIAVALLHAQHLAFAQGDTDRAIDLLRDRIDHLPVTEQLPLRGLLAHVSFYTGSHAQALAASRPLVESEPPQLDGCLAATSVYSVVGEPERVLSICDRTITGLHADPLPLSGAQSGISLANLLFNRLLALWQLGTSRSGDDPMAPVGPLGEVPYLTSSENERGLRAIQSFIRGHLDDAAECYDDLGDRLLLMGTMAFSFSRTVRAITGAQRGLVQDAKLWLAEVDATPPPSRAGFAAWIERARVWVLVAEGDLDGAVDASLAVAERHAHERFHVCISLHDVVRLGRPDLVVEHLLQTATRVGATWWERVGADHAEAALAGDPGALLNVSERFERGGLDLHAAEALAQSTQYVERGPELARARTRLADLLERCGSARTPLLSDAPALLTPRERQVAQLAALGGSNPEIAERLGTSTRTVGNQLQHVYEKLGIHDRAALVEALALPAAGTPDTSL